MCVINKKMSRCDTCRCKVRLDYFTCKCDPELKFCALHKYGFEHGCTIDHLKLQKKLLSTMVVKVEPPKQKDTI